jgi:hypothetical protein
MDEDGPQPGDFLDALDALDEVRLDDADEMDSLRIQNRSWFRVTAFVVAASLFVAAGYGGLRIILNWMGS